MTPSLRSAARRSRVAHLFAAAAIAALLAAPAAAPAQTAWVARNADIITVDLATGDRTTLATSGAIITTYRGLALEGATSLLACGSAAGGQAVVRINRADGFGTLLSQPGVIGAGANINGGTRAIAIESPTSAFVLALNTGGPPDNGLFRVDLTSGDRTAVSTDLTGSGPIWFTPWDLSPVLPGGDIVLQNVSGGVYVIDPDTGARTRINNTFSSYSIDLLDDGDLVLESFGGVHRMDTTTGVATILSGGTPTPVGSGPAFTHARAVAVDEGGALWVVDVDLDALVSVNVATGDRTIISQTAPPTGAGPSITGGTFDDFNDSMHLVVTNPSVAAAAAWDGF